MLQSSLASQNFPFLFTWHIVDTDNLKFVPLVCLNNIWLALLAFVPRLRRHLELKKSTCLKLFFLTKQLGFNVWDLLIFKSSCMGWRNLHFCLLVCSFLFAVLDFYSHNTTERLLIEEKSKMADRVSPIHREVSLDPRTFPSLGGNRRTRLQTLSIHCGEISPSVQPEKNNSWHDKQLLEKKKIQQT